MMTSEPAEYGRRANSDKYSGYSGGKLRSGTENSNSNNYIIQFPITPDNQPMEGVPASVEPYNSPGSEQAEGIARENKTITVSKRETAKAGGRKEESARGPAGEFDYNRLLYETKGTYGIGNAMAVEEDEVRDGEESGKDMNFVGKPWRPLTRKLHVPAAVLSPYRLLAGIRTVVLAFFLAWRITHKNPDAVWLWAMSVSCELWFSFSWLLDQLPKLSPVLRVTNVSLLKDKFETPSPSNPSGKSDLPGIDVFISTSDPATEPCFITSNTILSILASDYPPDKLSCFVSDDAGSLLMFESMSELSSFASTWVPFCRKHRIEPRNPDAYFSLRRDPFKNKARRDFVRDRRRVKREYDEFKVRINALPESIRCRSEAFHAREESAIKATWMADGTHWPGAWSHPAAENSRDDHPGIIQVMIKPPAENPLLDSSNMLDLSEIDARLPMLVYVSREKRPGCYHNQMPGAMNALLRASAIVSNNPFVLNLFWNHYACNSQSLREAMCFMMDRGGDRLCYVQFPVRFEGVDGDDPSDSCANFNSIYFAVNMMALDGLQGPLYAGTGCLFRRSSLYGFDPPRAKAYYSRRVISDNDSPNEEDETPFPYTPFVSKYGNSSYLLDSIPVTEYQGRPLADHPSVKNGRPSGALIIPRAPLDASTVAEAVSVVSCLYEEKTEWGRRIGWIYGSVAGDVVTGYRMHNRGWRSVYYSTKRDAFRCAAPPNLTERLLEILRFATGSVQIFFSGDNAMFAGFKIKFLQRIAYLNVAIHPFTSVFLTVYCILPALSLISGRFIVQTLNVTFLTYFFLIAFMFCLMAIIEIRWSGIELDEWWKNEQLWLISGTSAHLAAILLGMVKVATGIEIFSYSVNARPAGDDKGQDEAAAINTDKWTWLMIPPLTIIMVNLIAILVGVSKTVYSVIPQWNKLLGGVIFSVWVLAHLYPFAKGWLVGGKGKIPTIVFIWSGLIAITVSLLWVAMNPPSANSQIDRSFSLI